jgi:hypothetical protein
LERGRRQREGDQRTDNPADSTDKTEPKRQAEISNPAAP